MSSFSVVIPTYNRPEALARCLRAFQALEYGDRWDLVVVNDGGDQSISPAVERAGNALNLRIIHAERGGPARARNMGAAASVGEYLAFTDDDCEVEPDWLTRFAEAFEKGPWSGLGGQTLNPYPDLAAPRAWQHYLDFLMDYMRDDEGNPLLLPSNNVAYRRAAFDAVGGFDGSFPFAAGEDFELGYRLVANGFRQELAPAARIRHHHPMAPWSYLRMQFRYGRGGHYLERALARYAHSEVSAARSKRFYNALARSLRRDREPWTTWLLMGMTPIVFRMGSIAEAVRTQEH